MADKQPSNPETSDSDSKSGPGLVVWLVAGLVAIVAGVATPVIVQRVYPTTGSDQRSDDPVAGALEAFEKPAFISFGDITVNLDEGRLNRYLRVTLTLQVHENQVDEVTTLVEKHKARLKNWLLSYLSDKDMEEIRGAAGQNRLRREIQDEFNTLLFPDGHDRIHDVLFEQFAIQ